MSSERATNLVPQPPIESVWHAEKVRVTAFVSPGSELPDPGVWEQVIGEPPEKTTEQPRVGLVQCEGLFQRGILALKLQLQKLDWIYGVAPNRVGTDVPHLPVIGPASEAFDDLLSPIKVWLGSFSHVQRLAFGATVMQPAENHQRGYEIVDHYLPDVTVDGQSSDLRYRVNWRRDSNVLDDAYINRLSSWSVAQIRLVGLSGAGVQEIPGADTFACILELDINTPAERDHEIPNDKLVPMLDELVLLAKEIMESGAIR